MNRGKKYLRPYYEKYWSSIPGDDFKDLNLRTGAIKSLFPQDVEGVILDFGCGRGEVLSEISKTNPKAKIIGVDISKLAIKQARKNAPNAIFKTIVESKIIPIQTGSIDFIIAMDVVEHVYDTEWMFNEFARVLKIGGLVLISTPYCGLLKNLAVTILDFEKVFDPLGPHVRFYTRKSLEMCLKLIGFRVVNFDTFGRFYPFSKGMFVLAKKESKKEMRFEKYVV